MSPVMPPPAVGGQVPRASDIPPISGVAMLRLSPSDICRFTRSYIRMMLESSVL